MSMYILFKNSRFRNTYIKFPQKKYHVSIRYMSVQCKYNITTTELADYLFRWKIAEIYKSIFFEFVHARRIMSHKEL